MAFLSKVEFGVAFVLKAKPTRMVSSPGKPNTAEPASAWMLTGRVFYPPRSRGGTRLQSHMSGLGCCGGPTASHLFVEAAV